MVIKRYGNRRLYDTDESRYITMEDVAERIRRGGRVRVVDAKTNEDLTQQTLAHIILESRGASKLLPVPLLEQLIRMGDGALAEFFGMYVGSALEMYLQMKANAQAMMPYNPFMQVPMAAANMFSRMMGGWGTPPVAPRGGPPPIPYGAMTAEPMTPEPMSPEPMSAESTPHEGVAISEPEPDIDPDPQDETARQVAELRRELQELKHALRGGAGSEDSD